ncbi:hypothetical protein GCM10027053_08650 [Intrasporangium mesophilum]
MTVAYFDTSALIPLLVAEPASELSRRVWTSVDRCVSAAVLWPEATASLTKAQRIGRLDADGLRLAVARLERIVESIDLISVTSDLGRSAAAMSLRFGLRGFDAVHVATSLLITGGEVIGVSGDRSMVKAWRQLGLSTVDTAVAG